MKKILLCCAAGMSTSLLVNKMKAVADERGLEVEIWAEPLEKIKKEIGRMKEENEKYISQIKKKIYTKKK